MLYICYVNNDKQTHNDMNIEAIRATIEEFTNAFHAGDFETARWIADDLEVQYNIDAMDFI